MIKLFRLGLLAVAFILGFVALDLSAAEKVRWGVHFRANPYYGIPALAASEKGFWKEQGLEAEVVEFASAGLLERAYAAGTLEVGTTGMPDVFVSASRGGTQLLVADPKMQVDFVLWALAETPMKKPDDIKGTKIGVSRFGISPHILAMGALHKLGLEGQVKFVALGGGPEAIAALKTRSVGTLAFSNFTLLPLQAKGEVQVFLNLSEFVPGAEVAGAQAVTGHRDFVKKNPEAVKRAIRAFLKGADFVLKNKDWAVEKLVTYWRQPKDAAGLTFAQFRYGRDGRIDPKKLEGVLKFLVEGSLLAREKAPPVEAVYVKGLAD